jgi:predicted acylesterase/phospholipase RssA/CRP-like cAMP-binding protein
VHDLAATTEDLMRANRPKLEAMVPGVFGPLEGGVLEALLAEAEWVSLRRGERLFREGDPGDSLYFLVGGRLEVRVARGGAEPGRLVNEVAAGAAVGEMALVTGEARTASVYAARDSVLARLSRRALDAFSERHPSILRGIARVLVERVRRKDLEAAGPRRRGRAAISTIALVPLGADAVFGAFAARLEAALAAHGTVATVSSAEVERALGIPGGAEERPGDARDHRIRAWLEERERRHRFTVYRADHAATAWSRRCVRSADEVLLVGRAGDPAGRAALEDALLAPEDASPVAAVHRSLVLIHDGRRARPEGTAAWLGARAVERHHHVRLDRAGDLERLARTLAGRSVALVLSGGGARAAAHMGVIQAAEERGIPIDLIVGVSSGAGVGAQYALGMRVPDMIALNDHVWGTVRPHRTFTPPIVSLVGSRGLDRAAREVAGDADVADTWIPFACLSTNLTTGRAVLHRRGPLWKALRATAALPGVFVPVVERGDLLVDGGVIDNLPWRAAAELNDGPIIAVDATADDDAATRVGDGDLPSSWQVLSSWLNPFGRPLAAPSALQIVMRAASVSAIASREAAAGEVDLLLRPPVGRFGMLDFRAVRELAKLGRNHALEMFAAWRG